MHNRPHTEEAKTKMRIAVAARPRKWSHLPEKEISDRLLHSSATTRSIAKEYGCSDTTIKNIFKNHSTKEEREAAKIRKSADSKRGAPNPRFAKWRRSHDIWTGRRHQNEARLKQSLAKLGKPHHLQRRIAQSARVQGISITEWAEFKTAENQRKKTSIEYRAWRKAVFERDNYTCQHCGDRGKKGHCVELHPHHVKPKAIHPELWFEVSNGLTLCDKCHRKTPTYGLIACRQMTKRRGI